VPWSGHEVVRAARTVRSRHFAEAAPAYANRIKLRIGLLYRHSEADQRGWGMTTPSAPADTASKPVPGEHSREIHWNHDQTVANRKRLRVGSAINLGLIESEHAIGHVPSPT
jgi:hypothetical protein